MSFKTGALNPLPFGFLKIGQCSLATERDWFLGRISKFEKVPVIENRRVHGHFINTPLQRGVGNGQTSEPLQRFARAQKTAEAVENAGPG